MRRVAVDHMRARPDEYGIFFFSETEFDTFLHSMSQSCTWGDELTLRAYIYIYIIYTYVRVCVHRYMYIPYIFIHT